MNDAPSNANAVCLSFDIVSCHLTSDLCPSSRKHSKTAACLRTADPPYIHPTRRQAAKHSRSLRRRLFPAVDSGTHLTGRRTAGIAKRTHHRVRSLDSERSIGGDLGLRHGSSIPPHPEDPSLVISQSKIEICLSYTHSPLAKTLSSESRSFDVAD